MKAKCYTCGEKIDIHNKCRKRACRAQLEKRQKRDDLDWAYILALHGLPRWIQCD